VKQIHIQRRMCFCYFFITGDKRLNQHFQMASLSAAMTNTFTNNNITKCTLLYQPCDLIFIKTSKNLHCKSFTTSHFSQHLIKIHLAQKTNNTQTHTYPITSTYVQRGCYVIHKMLLNYYVFSTATQLHSQTR